MFDDYEADMLSDIDFAINRGIYGAGGKRIHGRRYFEIKQNLFSKIRDFTNRRKGWIRFF